MTNTREKNAAEALYEEQHKDAVTALMARAEASHQIALCALQEALGSLNLEQIAEVNDYLDSEDPDE